MIAFGSDFRSDFGRQDGAKTRSRGLQDGQDGPKRPQDDPQGAPKTAPRGFQKTDPRHPFLVLAARCLQGPPRTPPRAILKPFLIDSRPLQHRKNPLTSTLKNTSEGGIRCLFPLPPPPPPTVAQLQGWPKCRFKVFRNAASSCSQKTCLGSRAAVIFTSFLFCTVPLPRRGP